MNKKVILPIYNSFIIILAIISIILTALDFTNIINLSTEPYIVIDNTILIAFSVDYFGGLILSEDKIKYIKTHVFDLLAIIPFSAFPAFKIFRITRIVRIFRAFRIVGIIGKLGNKIKKFLKTNGFIYLIIICSTIILIAAAIFSFSEKVSIGNSIWWAITTSTTVGYGDISPTTKLCKVLAIILMLVGISFVGMLTSTFTSFFQKEDFSKPDELEKYFKLYKESAITKEEFNAKKKYLLSNNQ